jgi:hypothetical protein
MEGVKIEGFGNELERVFVRTKELGEEDFYCRIGTWCRCVDTNGWFPLMREKLRRKMTMSSRGLGRKNSKVVRLRVPIDLLDSWQHFIEDNKEDGAEVLRRVMAQLVGRPRREVHPGDPGTSLHQMRETSEVDRAPKKAVKLMLTRSEHTGVS